VREWLHYLAGLDRSTVHATYEAARAYLMKHKSAADKDEGAKRMIGNYAALLTAWRLLCDFAEIHHDQGGLMPDLVQAMNEHIADTEGDREPWVWIVSMTLSEIDTGNFKLPYKFDDVDGEPCLCIRPKDIMHHLSSSMPLRDRWNALPVKTPTVLKRQLLKAEVLVKEDLERTVNTKRVAHMVAISLEKIARFGLSAAIPVNPPEYEAAGHA